jgi:ABC-2 type transport system permease protein
LYNFKYMFSIFNKEINTFFSSLIGYIVIGIFLLLTGLLLWIFPDTSLLNQNIASIDQLFDLAPMIFTFLIPAVTMRLFAEENQTGTIEFLTTKPLTDWAIIGGKYLAGVALVALALIPTLVYYITMYQLGSPKGNLDSGAIAGSYIGLLLLGSAFVAIGLFASSLTNNQIVSFLIAAFLCFFMHWGFDFLSRLPIFSAKGDDIVQMFGITYHYQSISRGVVVLSDVVYYFTIIGLFLLVTKMSLESRKW